MNNSPHGLNRRFELSEEKNSKLKGSSVEIMQYEEQREKKRKWTDSEKCQTLLRAPMYA